MIFFLEWGGKDSRWDCKVRCNTWGSKVRCNSAAKNHPSARHCSRIGNKGPCFLKERPSLRNEGLFFFFFRLNQYFGEELISGNQPPPIGKNGPPLLETGYDLFNF